MNRRYYAATFIATLAIVSIAAVATAQPVVPPLPTENRAAVKTVWPLAWNSQSRVAALETRISAIETTAARLGVTIPAPPPTLVALTPIPATSTATPQPGATATAQPTAPPGGVTITPQPTVLVATIAPASTATAQPSPLPTAIGGVSCLNCVPVTSIVAVPIPAPDIHNKPCPAWAHDAWLVLAPNGLLYRTWHPSKQPENKPGAGCLFDHTHGPNNPAGSHADPSAPPYGYAADMHGMSEPHEGFKTFYANLGDCNVFESFCPTSDVKATFHQGTAGAGRVAQRLHTFIFDLKNSNGAEVHVQGMGDTGFAYNQCTAANSINNEQGTIGVRLFAMPRPLAASCGVGTPYEVWEWALSVAGDNRIHAKLGTFDAITVLNPATGMLEQTAATWPNGPFSGCKADSYFGPIYLNSAINVVDSHGLRQIVKPGNARNFPLDSVGKSAFKLDYDDCANQPYTKN